MFRWLPLLGVIFVWACGDEGSDVPMQMTGTAPGADAGTSEAPMMAAGVPGPAAGSSLPQEQANCERNCLVGRTCYITRESCDGATFASMISLCAQACADPARAAAFAPISGSGCPGGGEDLDADCVLDFAEDTNGDGILQGSEDVNRNGVLDLSEDINGNGILDISEDTNGNGVLDDGEDVNGNGVLDEDEDANGNGVLDLGEDVNGNGVLDFNEDLNNNGILDLGEDTNGNNVLDSGGACLVIQNLQISEQCRPITDLCGDACERMQVCDNGTCAPFACAPDVNEGGVRNDTPETATQINGADQVLESLSVCGLEDLNGDGILQGSEDANQNGFLDPSEDLNGNGILDPGEDLNGNGRLDLAEDANGNGILDVGEDINGNGSLDGDFDWFAITVPVGQNVFIDIAFNHQVGDVDAHLFSASDLESPVYRSTSASDNESFIIGPPADAPQTYYLKVFPFSGAQNSYSLYVNYDVPLNLCLSADSCDSGQVCRGASGRALTGDGGDNMAWDIGEDLGVCEFEKPCMVDDDCNFSQVCEVATGICRRCLDNTGCSTGDYCVDFECVDCIGPQDCVEDGGYCSTENQCVECLDDSNCPDGTCAGGICRPAACNDAYEPNDTAMTSTDLQVGVPVSGAYLCGDKDWYRFMLQGGETVYVQAEFLHDGGDVDMTLFHSDGACGAGNTCNSDNYRCNADAQLCLKRIDAGTSVTDNEYIGLNPATSLAGEYYLEVRVLGDKVQTYSLTVNVNPVGINVCREDTDCFPDASGTNQECDPNTDLCVPAGLCTTHADCNDDPGLIECNFASMMCMACTPDALEPNDFQAEGRQSTEVLDDKDYNLCSNGGTVGDDFYHITASEGDVVHVSVCFEHRLGDVDVHLLPDPQNRALAMVDDMGNVNPIDRSSGVSNLEIINYRVEPGNAGQYTVRVFGYSGRYNAYRVFTALYSDAEAFRNDGRFLRFVDRCPEGTMVPAADGSAGFPGDIPNDMQ